MTQIGDFNVVACRNDFFFFFYRNLVCDGPYLL